MRFGPVAISDMELHYRSVVPCHYMEYPVTSGLNGTCQWGSSAHERLGMEVPLCRTAFNLKLVPIILSSKSSDSYHDPQCDGHRQGLAGPLFNIPRPGHGGRQYYYVTRGRHAGGSSGLLSYLLTAAA